MSNVVYLKLISGEELLAEEVEPNVYSNLLQIIPFPVDSEQNFSIRAFPFPFAAQEANHIPININHILVKTIPDQQFVAMYNERFGKIQIVRNSFLTS
jgi:hypothetical protein